MLTSGHPPELHKQGGNVWTPEASQTVTNTISNSSGEGLASLIRYSGIGNRGEQWKGLQNKLRERLRATRGIYTANAEVGGQGPS